MCAYARGILTGRLPGPYSDTDAERFARTALIDPATFSRYPSATDGQLADFLAVPIELVTARRAELEHDPERDLEHETGTLPPARHSPPRRSCGARRPPATG